MVDQEFARNEAPYDWEQDFQARMNLVEPGDTTRGLFLKGALDAIRTLAGEEVAKRSLEACEQEKFVDFFSYSVGLQLRMIQVAMPTLVVRCGSADGALRHIGRQAALDFLESTTGKMMMKLAGQNPKRLVDSLPGAYRVSVSFGTRTVEWSAPKNGRVIMKREFMPPSFHAGVVETIIERGGASAVKVIPRRIDTLDSECEVSWQ